jgi:hypothetical protein
MRRHPLLPPIVQTVGRSLDWLSAPPSLGLLRAGKQPSTGMDGTARPSFWYPLGWARPLTRRGPASAGSCREMRRAISQRPPKGLLSNRRTGRVFDRAWLAGFQVDSGSQGGPAWT